MSLEICLFDIILVLNTVRDGQIKNCNTWIDYST